MAEQNAPEPFANAVVWEDSTDSSLSAVAETPAVAEPSEEVPTQEREETETPEAPELGSDVDESEAGDDGEADAQPGKPTGKERLNVRFSELTQRAKLAEQEAQHWKERALQAPTTPETSRPEPPAVPADGLQRDQTGYPIRPRQEYYGTTEEYDAATQRYDVAVRQYTEAVVPQIVEQALAIERQREADLRAIEAMQHAHPDYSEVMQTSRVGVNPSIEAALLASKHKYALMYHLAAHPEEAAEVNHLQGPEAYLAIARLEVQLTQPSQASSAPPEPPTRERSMTTAPPPIQPTRGAGGRAARSYDEMSWDEFVTQRNKEEQASWRR